MKIFGIVGAVVIVLIGLYVSTHTAPRVQLVVDGVAQGGITIINAMLAWVAMSRLDRTCRAYRHSSHTTDNMPPPTAAQFIPSQALVPLTLTSSQS